MRGIYWFAAILLMLPYQLWAQGSIVLVGGGSETEGGWSDEPYKWIVDHASNKRVAVISYAEEDDWIPTYFKSLGAVEAVNIRIANRSVAGLQSTYDELMTYDAFFFKGGDQSVYYEEYKNTSVIRAAIDKFNAGGVMSGTSAGMAILSGVVYTAKGGSVYPDEALANIYDEGITLASDMLPFLPGVVADSHFTERGRVGRLLPFMARWKFDHGETLTGIGVDDRTALCIGPDKKAKVSGTGTVSFYRGETWSVVQDEKPATDSVHVAQLLHGHQYNLATHKVLEGPTESVAPEIRGENGNYVIGLSGSNELAHNNDLLQFLVEENGSLDDTVIVVTGVGKGRSFLQKIRDLGGIPYMVETSELMNEAGEYELRNTIKRARKVLFVENADNTLFSFLESGPTGALIYNHIRRNGIVTCFVGDDSRYAGKTFVTNHRADQYAAYYGRLAFRKGLSLLSSSTIMANTFDPDNTDFYENTTAAVPYQLVTGALQFGIYLNARNTLRFYQLNGRNVFKANGRQSVLVLINDGTQGAVAFTPVAENAAPRHYVGFTSMKYVLLAGAVTVNAGVALAVADEIYDFEYAVVGVENKLDQSSYGMFPNPSADGTFRFSEDADITQDMLFTVTDLMGKTILSPHAGTHDDVVDLSAFGDGVYILRIDSQKRTFFQKLVKQR